MDKEFIPYDRALALKELGFDEECLNYYFKVYKENVIQLWKGTNKLPDVFFPIVNAPLYQQAFKWFREKYGLEGSIFPTIVEFNNSKPQIKYTYMIYNLLEYLKKGLTYGLIDAGVVCTNIYFDAYEEAEEACINKLIEIIKEKE